MVLSTKGSSKGATWECPFLPLFPDNCKQWACPLQVDLRSKLALSPPFHSTTVSQREQAFCQGPFIISSAYWIEHLNPRAHRVFSISDHRVQMPCLLIMHSNIISCFQFFKGYFSNLNLLEKWCFFPPMFLVCTSLISSPIMSSNPIQNKSIRLKQYFCSSAERKVFLEL